MRRIQAMAVWSRRDMASPLTPYGWSIVGAALIAIAVGTALVLAP